MRPFRGHYHSWPALVASGLYLVAAGYFIQYEWRHASGWINLRRLGVTLATLPSQLTFGIAFEWLGVPRVVFADPGLLGYAQLAFHWLMSAAMVYLAAWGLERLVRRFLLPGPPDPGAGRG